MPVKPIIDLKFNDEELSVVFTCNFEQALTKFNFSVNALFEIDSITSSNAPLIWAKTREYSPVFRATAQEIMVESDTAFLDITIKYHGKINGWCNIIEDNRKAVSFYSAWFPQETSIHFSDIIIRMHQLSDHFVLNARFNENEQVWVYGNNGYDIGNIITLKKGKYSVAGEGAFNFYYLSDEEAEAGAYLKYYFKDVVDYYENELYSQKEINRMDIVSLLLPKASGAYFRKELIVLSRVMRENSTSQSLRKELAAMMAHEIAHNWCSGAETGTWEDWLNETTAEWSALLYALDKEDIELFDGILHWRLDTYSKYPIIKTKDGSRPDGVHDRGTVLFYEIFKKYNKEILREMLRSFVFLKVKTTDAFLSELRKNVGNEVADIVERGLSLEVYENII